MTTTTPTTYETEIEHEGQLYFCFAEVDVHVTESSESFEHFGNRGTHGTTTAECEVTGFSIFKVEDKRTEIDDRDVRRAVGRMLEAEVQRNHFNICDV